MTEKSLQISRQTSNDEWFCLTCHQNYPCKCEACDCTGCFMGFLDYQKHLEGNRGRAIDVAHGKGKRQCNCLTPEGERDPAAQEIEFWAELCGAFDKRINPVPYYPESPAELGDVNYLPLHMEEIKYWLKVWKWSTYPWYVAHQMFAKKELMEFKQFHYDPRYIGTARMSESYGLIRPAFICDRFYYKDRRGFSFPVLVYQWFIGSDAFPLRGKAASYVVPCKDVCLVCPTNTDCFRIYHRLMRKVYEADPDKFVTYFKRRVVDWNLFSMALPSLREIAYGDEEIGPDFLEERFAYIDFAQLPYKTILRLPENASPDPSFFEKMGGGQFKLRNMEGLATRWLSFDHLNVDFNFDKECRIPFDLVKPIIN